MIMPSAPMPPRAIQRFEVSLKAFIVRGDGRALFVRESDTRYWELPGGRIDVGEEWLEHRKTLAREIAEELGASLVVAVEDAAVTWTRQRPADGVFQFIVGRVCRLQHGEPSLSDEHDEMAWLTAESARGLQFPPSSNYGQALEALWRLVSGRG
jgi:8-oxo-dGTP pyrophosphatase MutT (NUDIX family)